MKTKLMSAVVGVVLGTALFAGSASAALLPQSTVHLNDGYNGYLQPVTVDSVTVSNADANGTLVVYDPLYYSTGRYWQFTFSPGITTISLPVSLTVQPPTIKNGGVDVYSSPIQTYIPPTQKPASQCARNCANNQNVSLTWGRNLPTTIASPSGKCLNVPGFETASGTGLIQWDCEAYDNEIWTLAPVGDFYHLVVKHSNKCLNVPGASTQSGQQLIQWDCQGSTSTNDQWSITQSGTYTYQIKSRSSGLCLNMAGSSNSTSATQDLCSLPSANLTLPQLPAKWGTWYYIGGHVDP